MIVPSREEFIALSPSYDIIPVYHKCLADTETPITIFRKLVGTEPGCLLESVEENKYLGRYSFVAYDPFMSFSFQNGRGKLFSADGRHRDVSGNLRQVLKGLLEKYRFYPVDELPPFYGGAIGYLAYEAFSLTADKKSSNGNESTLPDCRLFFPGVVIVFDHLHHQVTVVVNCFLQGQDPARVYTRAVTRLEEIITKLNKPLPKGDRVSLIDRPRAETTDEEFKALAARAIGYVDQGEADQIVVSRRFACKFRGDDFQFYRKLRSLNPSPYMFYLNLGNIKAIGSSPEMLVRVEQGRVATCPIAGTRRRGNTPEEDRRLTQELLTDPKELAEHEMLVEFAVTDLQQVCRQGSVQVVDKLKPQYYSHVIHLTSRVEGDLKPGKHPVDALAACFPAGTVSGSPRQKAMEIIEKLEQNRRGIYGGAIGYFGFNGAMDTAIAIRTLVVKGQQVYIQSGAGIVAASKPERELEEIKEKAMAMFEALSVEN